MADEVGIELISDDNVIDSELETDLKGKFKEKVLLSSLKKHTAYDGKYFSTYGKYGYVVFTENGSRYIKFRVRCKICQKLFKVDDSTTKGCKSHIDVI